MTRSIIAAHFAAGFAASAAHADIIHFINPAPGEAGHYDWQSAVPGSANTWLDLTLSPAHQTGIANGNSVGQVLYEGEGSGEVVHDGGARVLNRVLQGMFAATEGLIFGEPVAPAQSPSRFWNTFGYMFEVDGGEAASPLFPQGERRYIGVLTEGGNRGWLEVELNGISFRAHSWAYESVPGIPISAGQIPAPGAAGLLVAASAVQLCRRRRAAAGSAVAA